MWLCWGSLPINQPVQQTDLTNLEIWEIQTQTKTEKTNYLVWDSQILTVLCNVLPDEDVVVLKEDVQQLINTIQALLPHVGLKAVRNTRFRTLYWRVIIHLIKKNLLCSVINIFQVQTPNWTDTITYTSSHLHEGRQVRVVVIQGGNDVEFNFDQDALTQVMLSRNASQSMKEFNLSSSVIKWRKKEEVGMRVRDFNNKQK